MSKTLKWIYQLGYKHAENKLYHQLMARAKDIHPTDSELFGIEDKPDYLKIELDQRQTVSWKMQDAIEDVFRPNTRMTVEEIQKNRFEL